MTAAENTKLEHQNSFWKTPLGRAMFGFESEIDCNPKRFFNFEYIQGLLRQESNSLRTYSKTFTGLLILNSLALFYMRGIKLNLSIAGFGLQNIPASAEIICLFLGLNIFGFSIHSLDIILFARIRYVVIHRLVGTDLVNMALVHLKDNGLWIDLLTPRFSDIHLARPRYLLLGFLLQRWRFLVWQYFWHLQLLSCLFINSSWRQKILAFIQLLFLLLDW